MKKFAKLTAVFAALVLALSCFVACSIGGNVNEVGNQGGGGSEQGDGSESGEQGNGDLEDGVNGSLENGGNDEQETPSLSEVASKSIVGYTTAETKTQAGNNVNEMLYLFEGGKFELYKNLSYENYSGFALFANGSYSGDISKNSLTFKIEEEIDTSSLSDEEKTMLGLSSESIQASDLISKLKSLIKKLESIERKNVSSEHKSIQIKSDGNSFLLSASGTNIIQNQKVTIIEIDLEGFLLTGNPVHGDNWVWPTTPKDGAVPLEKTSDGKYTCTFIADSNDTSFILIKGASAYWFSSVDLDNCKVPDRVKITNETEWYTPGDSEKIAIMGIECGRKYDITFDTAKTPGKICIELERHKVTTLDGWMLSGQMNGNPDPNNPDNIIWPFSENDGALPLKNIGNNKWSCSVTMKKGWNGFRLMKDNWTYQIGRSQLNFERGSSSFKMFDNRLIDSYYTDDTISFSDSTFTGTEKATLTFTVRIDGLIDIDCDIAYSDELNLRGYYLGIDLHGEATHIEDSAQEFKLSESEWYSVHLLYEKVGKEPPMEGHFADGDDYRNYFCFETGGCCFFDDTYYYWIQALSRYDESNDKLADGVSIEVTDGNINISVPSREKDYTLKFDTKSKKGYFSVIIE